MYNKIERMYKNISRGISGNLPGQGRYSTTEKTMNKNY